MNYGPSPQAYLESEPAVHRASETWSKKLNNLLHQKMTNEEIEEIVELKEKRRNLYLSFAKKDVSKIQKEYSKRTTRYNNEINKVNARLYELTKNTIYRF